MAPPPDVSISGQTVAFFGAGAGGQQGVYARRDGVLMKLADTATVIPGGTGMFTSIPHNPVISGENVVFLGDGSNGQKGIYGASVSTTGPPYKIVDTATAIPGGSGNFTSFTDTPAISGDRTVFVGNGAGGQHGIYAAVLAPPSIGSLIRVADTATAIPGGSGKFASFGVVSVSETNVAFLGAGASGQIGIYALTGGQLVKASAVGDTLGGKTVTGLNFTRSGLFGGSIAFQATFDDGSQALYTIAAVAPPFGLRITAVARLGNDLRLSFNSLAGTNYVLQSRSDLGSGSWTTLPGTTNSGNGGTVQQTLTNAVNLPQQFYRVKQLP